MKKILFGLREKVIIVVVSSIIGSGVLLFIVIGREITNALQKETTKLGVVIAQDISRRSVNLLMTEDVYGLHSLVNGVVAGYPEVKYMFIADADNRVVSHSFTRGFPAGLISVNTLSPGQDYRVQLLQTEQGILQDIVTPIFGGKLGSVHLGISFASVQSKLKVIMWETTALIVVSLMLSCFVIIFLVSHFINPLFRLIEATKKIGRGDFKYPLNSKVNDEISELFVSFNQMAEAISAKQNALMKEIDLRERTLIELRDIQDQLIQAGKMSALGQLAGGVAHELNNPLTGVLNNIQLIQMEAEAKKEFNPDDFKELLGIIESSALRCKGITQALLDFSHASKGKFSSVSLNEVADKTVELVVQELRLQNVSFKKELQPDLPLIQGDFQLLQQVVFGLINNAQWAIKKKSPEGGTITIGSRHDPAAKTVVLSVSDPGIGISEENVKKLFTPFFTTKEVGEGTGLGLALFYNIVKSMNGNIKVESKEGEGATFLIALPC
jgi:two-component system, NtrC family, sensor kinase